MRKKSDKHQEAYIQALEEATDLEDSEEEYNPKKDLANLSEEEVYDRFANCIHKKSLKKRRQQAKKMIEEKNLEADKSSDHDDSCQNIEEDDILCQAQIYLDKIEIKVKQEMIEKSDKLTEEERKILTEALARKATLLANPRTLRQEKKIHINKIKAKYEKFENISRKFWRLLLPELKKKAEDYGLKNLLEQKESRGKPDPTRNKLPCPLVYTGLCNDPIVFNINRHLATKHQNLTITEAKKVRENWKKMTVQDAALRRMKAGQIKIGGWEEIGESSSEELDGEGDYQKKNTGGRRGPYNKAPKDTRKLKKCHLCGKETKNISHHYNKVHQVKRNSNSMREHISKAQTIVVKLSQEELVNRGLEGKVSEIEKVLTKWLEDNYKNYETQLKIGRYIRQFTSSNGIPERWTAQHVYETAEKATRSGGFLHYHDKSQKAATKKAKSNAIEKFLSYLKDRNKGLVEDENNLQILSEAIELLKTNNRK